MTMVASYTGTRGTVYMYLLEYFGVSYEFYDELAMVHPSLPRLFNISA